MNKVLIILSFLLLFADSVFSMEFDRVSRDKREQVNMQMAKLVDTVIDERVIPEQASIEAVVNDCFDAYQHNYQSAFLAFTYQIPEEVSQVSSELLKSLTAIFDKILFRLSTQN